MSFSALPCVVSLLSATLGDYVHTSELVSPGVGCLGKYTPTLAPEALPGCSGSNQRSRATLDWRYTKSLHQYPYSLDLLVRSLLPMTSA